MSKYQLGDIIGEFEDEIWVYGLNQPIDSDSKTLFKFEFTLSSAEFEQNYRILSSKYHRIVNANKEGIEMGYKRQCIPSKKGKGAFPMTTWIRKESNYHG